MFTKSARQNNIVEPSGLTRVISALTEFTGTTSEIVSIVDAVERDHEDLKKFISLLKNEKTPVAVKRRVYGPFVSLLTSHARSEEKAMYSLSQSLPGLKLRTLEGYIEHNVANSLAKKIPLEPSHKELPKWLAQVQVLAELVEHHVQEEENELLPEIKNRMSDRRQKEACRKFVVLRKRSQKTITKDNAGVLAQA